MSTERDAKQEHDPEREPDGPTAAQGDESTQDEAQDLDERQGDATTADPTPTRHLGPDDKPAPEESSR
ncbi:hypothetical protein ACFWA9_00360 [Kitasatospora sp. NPDC059973]|uniref:hypothetical protein n=1 Tax=unclassified Kitasatospora TaxID=2633591 RepID=UPI003334546D